MQAPQQGQVNGQGGNQWQQPPIGGQPGQTQLQGQQNHGQGGNQQQAPPVQAAQQGQVNGQGGNQQQAPAVQAPQQGQVNGEGGNQGQQAASSAQPGQAPQQGQVNGQGGNQGQHPPAGGQPGQGPQQGQVNGQGGNQCQVTPCTIHRSFESNASTHGCASLHHVQPAKAQWQAGYGTPDMLSANSTGTCGTDGGSKGLARNCRLMV